MKFDKSTLLLYAVTDRKWVGSQSLYEQIEDAINGGVTIIQLREKKLCEDKFIEEAIKVREICHRYHIPLIINDNVKVALKSGADGVHVGIEDMSVDEIRKKGGKNFIIGATAKTVEQARAAEKAGADYLGVGAVFPSPTKENAVRITKEKLYEICSSVSIPVVAIGGITSKNISEIKGGGMVGVAVVSAVFSASNIKKATMDLKEKVKEAVKEEIREEIREETREEAKDETKEKVKEVEEVVPEDEKVVKKLKTVLSVAGSDSSGGAGIQADIKTMTVHGVYGMSAITALTAQNTTGVTEIMEVSPEFLEKQINAVFEDIPPDAVKIGMVSSSKLIKVIAKMLCYYHAKNIVIDPVMVATSGSRLMQIEAMNALKKDLLPIASLITPNISEAEILSEMEIHNKEDMMCVAQVIAKSCGAAVLLKGGHRISDADDLLYMDGRYHWFEEKRIHNPNTHGTGCTLSSAIAANLAKGFDLEHSVLYAKKYLSGALSAMLDLGKGSGPLNHAYDVSSRFIEKN